jgi:manganese-dependent inorganic pyrophosphatase
MMKNVTYIVGHKSPDTDSVCSAIAYARLKELTGNANVVPCSAGKLNKETEFVLNYYGVPVPMVLADLHIRVQDLMGGEFHTVVASTSLREAWQIMKAKEQKKTLLVVDEAGKMIGVITIGDIGMAFAERVICEADDNCPTDVFPTSVSVESVMHTEGIISFQQDDLVTDVRKIMVETRFYNYPVLDEVGRVIGLIGRYDLLSITPKKVILVDHNEWGQAVTGAATAQLMEVIDHHKVGGIQTVDPIYIRVEPVGSTCTIVTQCYKEKGLVPEKAIAGILLAAILSDTVIFKSPTCTALDKETAAYLAAIAGVEPMAFGIEMFKASSNIADRTPQGMIEEDLKAFTMGPHKVGVGQVSLMGMDGFEDVRANLTAAIEAHRVAQEMRYLCLMVTDILTDSTELIVTGENPEEVAKAFGKTLIAGSVDLPGVLSRKKQVVPQMTTFFQA